MCVCVYVSAVFICSILRYNLHLHAMCVYVRICVNMCVCTLCHRISDHLLYLEIHHVFTMHVGVIVRMCAYIFACANLGARVCACVYVYVSGVDLFYMQIQTVFTMHVYVRVCMGAYFCVDEYVHV